MSASDPPTGHDCLIDGLLVCVGGSIAAAGIPLTVQTILEQRIADRVTIVLSEAAAEFVSPATLAVLAGAPCVTDVFAAARGGRAVHAELARTCELAAVAPATANLVGKLANGIVDCTVTTVLSVFPGPSVLFPAVHPATLRKPWFERNLAQLESDGHTVVGPVVGLSVSEHARTSSAGAMPGPDDVATAIARVAASIDNGHTARPEGHRR